jgi:hypothetical protein
MKSPLIAKHGQPSWRLKSNTVDLFVTRTAGMMAPATFNLPGGRAVQPFAVAPWAGEKIDAGLPPLLHALRGDFFCAPFGGNGVAWRGAAKNIRRTANRPMRIGRSWTPRAARKRRRYTCG